jgi:hypothetical protein
MPAIACLIEQEQRDARTEYGDRAAVVILPHGGPFGVSDHIAACEDAHGVLVTRQS